MELNDYQLQLLYVHVKRTYDAFQSVKNFDYSGYTEKEYITKSNELEFQFNTEAAMSNELFGILLGRQTGCGEKLANVFSDVPPTKEDVEQFFAQINYCSCKIQSQ